MMSQGNHTPSSSTIPASEEGGFNSSVASSASEDFGGQENQSVLFEFIIPGVLLNTIGEETERERDTLSSCAKKTFQFELIQFEQQFSSKSVESLDRACLHIFQLFECNQSNFYQNNRNSPL